MGGLIVTNYTAGLDFQIGNVWFLIMCLVCVCVCVCVLSKGKHSGVATNFPSSAGVEGEQPKSKELFIIIRHVFMSPCYNLSDNSVRRTCDKDSSTSTQNESEKESRQKIYNTRARKVNPTTTKEIMAIKPLAKKINCKYDMHNHATDRDDPCTFYPSDCAGFT